MSTPPKDDGTCATCGESPSDCICADGFQSKTPTEKELRELDAWIAEHVMGYKVRIRKPDSTYPALRYWNKGDGFEILQAQFSPTTNPADAFEVLKKCYERAESFESGKDDSQGWYFFVDAPIKAINASSHESLELAVCLFARKLFSK